MKNIRLCNNYTKVTRWCGRNEHSIQWTQWNSGIWWVHCLWCKKVKPVDAVYSGIVVYDGGDIVFGAKRSNQWMQYTVDTVRSRIVVYDGEDIVFGAERSNQWMQYAVDAVE